jgi:hypothetical protein
MIARSEINFVSENFVFECLSGEFIFALVFYEFPICSKWGKFVNEAIIEPFAKGSTVWA